jgi:hypothetical protein
VRSKNVGTSNRNAGEIPARRKTKVSFPMIIREGLVGPKEIPKGASDGQTVNIPSLHINMMGGRSVVCLAYYWIYVHCIGVDLQENPGSGFDTNIRML